jgi:hypothetical protein
MKTQKRFTDDYFIALIQRLRAARQQAPAPVDERTVSRPKILDGICAVTI